MNFRNIGRFLGGCGVVLGMSLMSVCAQTAAPKAPLAQTTQAAPAEETGISQAELQKLALAAKDGDVDAQCQVGDYYFQKKEYITALKWYRAAAAKKNPDAILAMGMCYAEGLGVKQSNEDAVKCFQFAGPEACAELEFMLGYTYSEGLDDVIKPDQDKALYWVRLAAEGNHPEAQGLLGECYASGDHVQEDHKEAIRWFQLAAKNGNAGAMGILGDYLAVGKHVKQNLPAAVQYYERAAAGGDVESMFNLGVSYQNGVGVEMNDKTAMEWFSKAAAEEMPEAQYNLGLYYYEGKVVPADDQKAYELFQAAAEQGFAPAEEILKDFEVEEETASTGEKQE